MPIQLKADDIRKRAEASFDSRVKTATEQKIERIGRVTNALIDALSAELDAHFERQEKAQGSPYPHSRTQERNPSPWDIGARLVLRGFKTDEVALALGAQDESLEIWRRVAAAFSEAGYSLEAMSSSHPGSVEVFVRDPEFRP